MTSSFLDVPNENIGNSKSDKLQLSLGNTFVIANKRVIFYYMLELHLVREKHILFSPKHFKLVIGSSNRGYFNKINSNWALMEKQLSCNHIS